MFDHYFFKVARRAARELRLLLKVWLTPDSWIQEASYSALLDLQLRQAVEKGDVDPGYAGYCIRVGGLVLFSGTAPKTCLNYWVRGGDLRPSRRTMQLVHEVWLKKSETDMETA